MRRASIEEPRRNRQSDRRPQAGFDARSGANRRSRPGEPPEEIRGREDPHGANGDRQPLHTNGDAEQTIEAADDPVAQDRLVEPRLVVEGGTDVVTALDHLARGLYVERLVRVPDCRVSEPDEVRAQSPPRATIRAGRAVCPRTSMPEMPAAGEHHREAALVGGCNHLRITHRSSRLHDSRGAGVGQGVEAVAERKERIGRNRRSREEPGAAFITATFTASTRLICPAPTASVRSGPVKTIVFDFTCAQTLHANRSAVHSSAVGARCVTTFGKSPAGQGSAASPTRSRSCARNPPRKVRDSIDPTAASCATYRSPRSRRAGSASPRGSQERPRRETERSRPR